MATELQLEDLSSTSALLSHAMEKMDEVRNKANKYMAGSTFGSVYRGFMLAFSLISLWLYITRSYLNRHDHPIVVNAYDDIEWILGVLFAFDWSFGLFLAEVPLQFVCSFFALVDMCTVIATFSTWGQHRPEQNSINSFKSLVLYILFGMNTVRILRSLRMLRYVDEIVVDPVDRFIGRMSVTMSIFLLFSAAIIHYLEQDEQTLEYHTWVYFIWIITATVGYGDLSAHTTPGRFAVISILAFAVFTVPKMTNELLDLMSRQSIYSRMSYVPKGKRSQHIVICGDIRSLSISEFFEELFHEDHENDDLNVVLLQTGPPSVELALMLRDAVLSLNLTYLQGSALNDKDLERAHVTTAEAIFIMANKFSTHPDEEDAKTILQQFSIKRYCTAAAEMKYSPLFCLQLIRPENQRHLATSDNEAADSKTVIVCFNEIKMGVLAKAIMFPGTNTFIMNLISSFAEEEDENDDDATDERGSAAASATSRSASMRNVNGTFDAINTDTDDHGVSGGVPTTGITRLGEGLSSIMSSKRFSNYEAPVKKDEWLTEYKAGCDWEIYCSPLSSVFEGMKFVDMAFLIYSRLGITVFGMKVKDKKFDIQKVLLNPGKYVIPNLKDGDFEVNVFVVAKNKADSDLSNLKAEDLEHFTQALNGSQNAPTVTSAAAQAAAAASHLLARISSTARGTSSGAGAAGVAAGDSASSKKAGGKQLWKLLKRSNLLQKKIEMDTFQEKINKLEEKHMIDFYYYRGSPIDIEDCFIKTSVVEEIPHINNHLIIMGNDLSNLYDLIRPLRAKYLGSLKYIVILYPEDIPHAVWKRICYFDAILVVKGSSLEEADIRRAGIFRASQVVILADSQSYEKHMNSANANGTATASNIEKETLIDSDSVFTFQCVRRLNPHTQVVVEIVQHENIAYMDSEIVLKKEEYKFTPQFASGALFTTSLLDSLVCQAFYSPDIIKVVNKLVSGVDHLDRSEIILSASVEQEIEFGEDDERYKMMHSSLSSVETSCLYLIPVPEALQRRTFSNLFKLLIEDHCVPLGLLRGTFSHVAMGPKSNRLPYVFTNPDPDCEVYSCDRVFVLSMVPIQANRVSVKDWILDIQMHKKLAEQKASTKDNSLSAQTSLLYSKIRNLSKRQQKLDAKLDTFGLQMNIKFELMSKILSTDPTKDRTAEELEVLEKAEVSYTSSTDVIASRRSSASGKGTAGAAEVLAEWNNEINSLLEFSATELAADVQRDAEKVLEASSTTEMRMIAESTEGLDYEIRSEGSSDNDEKSVGTMLTDMEEGSNESESEEEDEKQRENAREMADLEKRQEMQELAARMGTNVVVVQDSDDDNESRGLTVGSEVSSVGPLVPQQAARMLSSFNLSMSVSHDSLDSLDGPIYPGASCGNAAADVEECPFDI